MAANNQRVAAVAIRYIVDEATVRAAERSAETVQTSLQQITPPLAGLGVAAQNSVDRLESRFRAFDRQLDLTESNLEDLEDDLNQLDQMTVTPEIIIPPPEIPQPEVVRPPRTRPPRRDDSNDDTERRRTESYGDVSTTFGSIASVVGAGGADVGSLRLIGDLTGTLEYLPRFSRGLQELGEQVTSTGSITTRVVNGLSGVLGAGAAKAAVSLASLGALGAALTVLAVITDQFARQSEENQRRLQSALDAQNAYYNALGENQTVEQVTTEIERLQARQAALAEQISETSSRQEAAFAQASSSFGDLGARVLDNQIGVGLLRGQLEELQGEFSANENTIARYQTGLEEGRFATESAIEAERELARERADVAAQVLQDAREEIEQREELRRLRQAGDDEAVQALIRQANRERINRELQINDLEEDMRDYYNEETDPGGVQRDAIQSAIDTLEEEIDGYEDDIEDYNRLLADIASDSRSALRGAMQDLQQGREFVAQQIIDNPIGAFLDRFTNDDDVEDKDFDGASKFADAYADAVRNTATALEAAERAQDAYDTAVQSAADKLADAQAQIEDRLADAEANDAQAREEAAIKLGRDLAEAEREYGEQRLAITRRYNATTANAIASRDALALILARRNRDQELDQAEAQDEARRGNIERAYKQQEADLTRNLERQRQQITNDGNARLAQLRAQGNAEIQARAQTLSRANTDLANAQAQERALRVQAIATTNQIVATGLATTTNHFRTAIDQINAYASKLGTGAGKGVGSGLSGGIGGTGYLPAAASTIPASMQPQQQTINNIVVNTATNRREVTALSNDQARRVLGQYLEN